MLYVGTTIYLMLCIYDLFLKPCTDKDISCTRIGARTCLRVNTELACHLLASNELPVDCLLTNEARYCTISCAIAGYFVVLFCKTFKMEWNRLAVECLIEVYKEKIAFIIRSRLITTLSIQERKLWRELQVH